MHTHSQLFDPPRWKGGPVICLAENLPAFESVESLKAFRDALFPVAGPPEAKIKLCDFCGWFHFYPKKVAKPIEEAKPRAKKPKPASRQAQRELFAG